MEDFSPQSSTTDREIPKKTSPLNRKLILPIILLFLVLVVGFYVWNKGQEKPVKTSTDEKKTSTTSSKPKSDLCPGEQEFTSTKQGYQVCFPTDWTNKELLPSNIQVGFGPGELSSTFPGTISVSISDKSEAIRTQEVGENSSRYEFGTTNLNGTKGTQISFTRLRNDALIAYPRGIETVVVKNNRTYLIALNSTEAELEANTKIYEDFLKKFTFLDDVLNPPWSESRNILVFSPWLNDSIKSPIDIEGVGIAFEGVIQVRVKDSDKHILTETTIQAESGVERAKFKGRVEFTAPSSKKGTVEIFTKSAKDGEEQDKVTIPVNFN